MFWVLRHHARTQLLRFVSGSQASHPDLFPSFFFSDSPPSRPDWFPYFCSGFSSIALGFNTFVLVQVLKHCARIRSISFVSGSLALPLDLIPSYFISLSGIVPRFDPFLLIRVLLHYTQIRYLPFLFFVLRHRA